MTNSWVGNFRSIKRTTARDENCPGWQTGLIKIMPAQFRIQRLDRIEGATREETVRNLCVVVSRQLKQSTIDTYGPDHPQAAPDYVWTPFKTDHEYYNPKRRRRQR